MKKTMCWFLIVISLFTSACAPSPSSNDELIVGFCLDTLVLERWQRDLDNFTREIQQSGATVQSLNASGDVEQQKRHVQDLIEQGVAAIVIVPIDSQAFTAEVELAHKKGIPIIAYDRLIANAGVDAFISFDTENIGSYMVRTLAQVKPTGNYVIVGGSLTDANMPIIANSIKRELANYPGIHLAAEAYCDNWSSSNAFENLSGILREDREIDAVLCGNDSLAVGAIRALSEYQMAGDVAVSGQDADLESCQRIVEGTQTMTVYKPLDQLAQRAAQVTMDLINGEKPSGGENFLDGTYLIHRYVVPVQAITASNMLTSIIQDEFHKLEDVYRNLPQEAWPTDIQAG